MVFGVTRAGEKVTYEPFRVYNEEISIVGFDELPWADVVAPRDIVFEPELTVRSSSVKSRTMRKSIRRKAAK